MPNQEAAIALIRTIILAANPEVGEEVKWNSPSFYLGDSTRHFATLNLHPRTAKGGVLIIFHQGAKVKAKGLKGPKVEDPAGLLTWLGKERCSAWFQGAADVEGKRGALGEVVRQWIAQL